MMCRLVQGLVRESQSGTRDVRGYTTDHQTSTRRLVRDLEPAVEKKPQFEIDLRAEGVSQDALLQDEEKMKKNSQEVGKVENWIMHNIHSSRLVER